MAAIFVVARELPENPNYSLLIIQPLNTMTKKNLYLLIGLGPDISHYKTCQPIMPDIAIHLIELFLTLQFHFLYVQWLITFKAQGSRVYTFFFFFLLQLLLCGFLMRSCTSWKYLQYLLACPGLYSQSAMASIHSKGCS